MAEAPLATYGSSTAAQASTTPASPAPASSAPASSGTFPQATTSNDPSASQIVGAFNSQGTHGLSQFFAYYNITSSTTQSMYTNVNSAGQQSLNQNAVDLVSFYNANQADRLQIEDQLVGAGLLSSSDATGIPNSSSIAAFKEAITQSAPTGQSTLDWLQQNGTGTASIENQVAEQSSRAEGAITSPVAASVENPTTLAATITNAFDQELGFAPNQDQVNSFISQIQGQDVSNAEAPRAEGQAELSQAESEQSALNKLGPNGIDQFLTAYQSAISGGGLPGGGSAQGPATGSTPNPNSPYITPGTKLGADTNVSFNANGAEIASTQPATQKTTTQSEQVPNDPNSISPFSAGRLIPGGHIDLGTRTVSKTTTSPVEGVGSSPTAPNIPAGFSNTTPTYGGMYALSPALWQQAKALTPSAKNYATAGAAPQSVQQAAVTNLASSLYEKSSSWSDVAIEMAGGTPGKTTGGQTAMGTKTNIQSFATNIANQVNSQIESIQNQVNNSSVTVKETSPDANAEASQAAKEADPTGYYAGNYASWGGMLSKMLFGTPLAQMESSADTFSGPVGSTSASGSPAPTNTPTPSAAPAAPVAA